MNKINVIIYENYLPILEVLNLIEKMLIYLYYWVMSIVQLLFNRVL